MKQSDKMDFFEAVSIATASYGKSLDEFMLASWWACLNAYELDAIKKALLLHQGTKNGSFAPRACHILEQLNDGGEIDYLDGVINA